jgi:hypothetical protein
MLVTVKPSIIEGIIIAPLISAVPAVVPLPAVVVPVPIDALLLPSNV